ncbi:RNA polymerase sigma-70 factor, ECF subfamily [Pedobacter terrae]|uniref:RNA polymerase sigma-70 factor, ECF subfamily n=1 Tax=Pedobacter terrae TaxID=405671 RepID=A0A1G8B019_9SPHI|nr:RNA polymerase sigma factor [Pedobacter terrae]SDH26455.1 RNA polymerase sigma-70 factor, ECF subfamily [Pedobacter terrae]
MEQENFCVAAEYHKQSLLAQALKLTADEDDAKDLVQDTLIRAVGSCSNFSEGTNMRGWLYVIMKNTFYNSCCKQKRRTAIWESDDCLYDQKLMNSPVNNLSETKMVLEDIQKAMNTLRADYRTAFQRYFEGYSYDEIALELNIPLGTVKTYIYQARQSLKKYLRIYR